MKRVYLLLFAVGMFTFVACNMGAEEGEETSTEAETEVETPAEEVTEQLADHVCNDKCTEAGCHFLHGEKGHVCGDDCKTHEGEEHPKGDDESSEG